MTIDQSTIDALPELLLSNRPVDVLRREKIRRACIADLSTFVRAFWKYVDHTDYIDAWHMEVINDHLQALYEREFRRLIINIPPGHSKSLLSSVFFPAWIWLRNPAFQGVYASHSKDLSIRDSIRCRDLIRHEYYRKLFVRPGGHPPIRFTKELESYYTNSDGGFRFSTSVTSQVTGWRGHIRVIDDPLNAQDDYNLAQLEDINRWWETTMSSRLRDPRTGLSLVVMQRLHDRDLSGFLIDKYNSTDAINRGEPYVTLALPTEYDSAFPTVTPLFDDPREIDGELLFPEMYTREVVNEAKTALGDDFNGQHNQRPSAKTGNIVHRDWIDVTPTLPVPPALMAHTIACWDFPVEDKKTSSWAVGELWQAQKVDGVWHYYLSDVMREHADIVRSQDMVREFLIKHPYTQEITIEKKANGAPIIQLMKSEFPIIEPFNPKGSKEARFKSVAPEFRRGYVHVNPAIADFPTYVEEVTKFPRYPTNDMVDMTSQGILRLKERIENGKSKWNYAA